MCFITLILLINFPRITHFLIHLSQLNAIKFVHFIHFNYFISFHSHLLYSHSIINFYPLPLNYCYLYKYQMYDLFYLFLMHFSKFLHSIQCLHSSTIYSFIIYLIILNEHLYGIFQV